MELYPFKLKGVTKSPIWGGVRLLKDWNKSADCETVGESWELTVRAQDMCCVENGSYAGMPLGEVIRRDRNAVMGASAGGDMDFPLLVKLIDAADRLSVQVHPDDAYAARVEQDRGKTEMWYIVEADADAEIVCGLADGASAEDYARAVTAGDFESLLKKQPVCAGETYFIPAGLPHAIGRGILIAEIQQNCDLTYRVYDYERRQKDGSLRPLHTQKALDVIRPFSREEIEEIRYFRGNRDGNGGEVLTDCEYFRVERLCLDGGEKTLGNTTRMRHLLCLEGNASLETNESCYPVQKGDSYLLPAALSDVTVRGNAVVLISDAY